MTLTPELLEAAHRFCAIYMTGIIWFVQLVQYPMLHLSSGQDPAKGHQEYTRRMGLAVGPVMLAELGLQISWIAMSPGPRSITGGILLFIIWASTIVLQVPCHRDLEQQYDAETHRELVRSNWIRTLAWTARALLLSL
jgi:hypothetical protein